MRIFSVDDTVSSYGRTGPYYDDCQFLGMEFFGPDWTALFHTLLGTPSTEPYQEGETVHLYYQRQRAVFQAALADYPMLARIWDLFGDIWYDTTEVDCLQRECLELKAMFAPEQGTALLNLLLDACHLAQAKQHGLVLGGG